MRACLHTEAKVPCCPDVPYTPAKANARNLFNVLKMLVYQCKHHIDFSDQLREPILRHSEKFEFSQTLEECQVRCNVALKDLKALERSERKTSAHRDKYLAEKAEACASQGEVSAAQYLKQLKQCESMSRVFQRCANTRGAHQLGGISTIEVPQDPSVPPRDCTEWKALDCPQEIESALLEYNRKHFGQAQRTSFTVPPYHKKLTSRHPQPPANSS
jgi:hypothetical protein